MLKAWLGKYKEQIVYLFFGILTTIVDFVVYELTYWCAVFPISVRATASNIVAWIVAVVFAYVTNKPFVFKSSGWSLQKVSREFTKFVGMRFVSLCISTLIIFVLADLAGFHNLLIKALASVFVIIFNYFASKFFVFSSKQ